MPISRPVLPQMLLRAFTVSRQTSLGRLLKLPSIRPSLSLRILQRPQSKPVALYLQHPGLHPLALGVVCFGGRAGSKVKLSSAGSDPAWREALVHTIVGSGWEECAPTDEINGTPNDSTTYVTTLRNLEPDSGASARYIGHV